jgi:hypothetical protein
MESSRIAQVTCGGRGNMGRYGHDAAGLRGLGVMHLGPNLSLGTRERRARHSAELGAFTRQAVSQRVKTPVLPRLTRIASMNTSRLMAR